MGRSVGWGISLVGVVLSAIIACRAVPAPAQSFMLPDAGTVIFATGILQRQPIDAETTIAVQLDANATEERLVTAQPAHLYHYDVLPEPDRGSAGGSPHPSLPFIPRERVTVAPQMVKGGALVELPVRIRAIARPGYYKGDINLFVQGTNVARRVQLILIVALDPILELAETAKTVQVTDCQGSCGFTALIAPGASNFKAVEVVATNRSPAAILVDAVGHLTNQAAPGRVASLKASSVEIPANQTGVVTVALGERVDLALGSYEGVVRLRARAKNAPGPEEVEVGADSGPEAQRDAGQSLALTLNVKASAFYPFLIVLLGVVSGRLAKWRSEPSRAVLRELYAHYVHLGERISRLADPAAQQNCALDLEDIWSRVLPGNQDNATLRQELERLAVRVDLFARLEALAAEATRLGGVVPDNVSASLMRARDYLFAKDLASARTELVAAGTALSSPLDSLSDEHKKEVEVLRNGLHAARETAASQVEAEKKRGSVWRRGAHELMASLSGIDTTRSVAFDYWFLRPLFFVVLVIVVAFYGVWLLYAGPQHSTFGAQGMTEYIGLFLWGFGAQVVALSLTNFTDGAFDWSRRPAPQKN